MKIDFMIDFDALLLAAKAKHRMYVDKIDEYRPLYKIDVENGELLGYPPDIQAKINEAREQWEQWVKTNITSRGLELANDTLGCPVAITAVLAGEKKGVA